MMQDSPPLTRDETRRVARADASTSPTRKLWKAVSPANVSALYLAVALFVIFSIWVPDLFLRGSTFSTLLSADSITYVVAIAIVIPLATGTFDLTVGYTVGFCATLLAWANVLQGWSMPVSIGFTMLVALLIGAVNAFLIVAAGINSFIATLGTGSVIQALTVAVSDGKQINGFSNTFLDFSSNRFLTIAVPVYVALLLAFAAWYFLQHTPAGRYFYATGGNADAARLSGVRTELCVSSSLLMSAGVAGFGGVLLASQLGSSSPTIGAQYLLPGFAAVFVGSTQFQRGRPNVWGAMLAIVALGVGTKGFDLVGVDYWIKDLFYGVALVVAVGLSVRQANGRSSSASGL